MHLQRQQRMNAAQRHLNVSQTAVMRQMQERLSRLERSYESLETSFTARGASTAQNDVDSGQH
jgi:hypothetical protein